MAVTDRSEATNERLRQFSSGQLEDEKMIESKREKKNGVAKSVASFAKKTGGNRAPVSQSLKSRRTRHHRDIRIIY